MIYPALDVFSIMVFLSGLIGLVSLRSIIRKEDTDSYRNMFTGFVILILFSAAKLSNINLLFADIPFIKESIFFNLVYWIGMITGMALLINGVSTWLPIFKQYKKYNSEKIRQLELFKKIEQLIRVENRVHVILLSSLEKIVESYEFTDGSVYLFSNTQKVMTLLGSYAGNRKQAKRYTFDNKLLSSYEPKITIVSDTVNQDSTVEPVILPIRVKDKLVGTFVFSFATEITNDQFDNLKIIAEILSEKIQNTKIALQDSITEDIQQSEKDLVLTIDHRVGIRENMTCIKQHLRKYLPIDYISVCIENDSYSGKFSLHQNDQILEEPKFVTETNSTLEKYVMNYELPVIIPNTSRETALIIDPLILKSDLKSMIALPIVKNEFTAVCTVASASKNVFQAGNIGYLKPVIQELSQLITNELEKKRIICRTTRKEKTRSFLKDISRCYDQLYYFHRATKIINDEFHPSFIRLSLFDDDRRFLNSQVLETEMKHLHLTPQDASMLLSLMPGHRAVNREKRTLLFDENTPEFISREEQRQVYGKELQWLMITPLILNSKVVGVISLGDDKSKETRKLTHQDIEYIEEIAALAATGMSLTKTISLRLPKRTGTKYNKTDAVRIQVGSQRLQTETPDMVKPIELSHQQDPILDYMSVL